MRLSCNGCRILRKGCTDDCIIRPCLHWIKSADSQANATLFLAKFYGRAGLMNLINAGPEHLRPDIFKSLLYEACGRIVDPMYGSAGLLSSGNWQHCQAAVDAVLSGSPIMQVPSSDVPVNAAAAAAAQPIPLLTPTDIRHVIKDSDSTGSHDLPKVKARRNRSRRFAPKPKSQVKPGTVTAEFGNPECGLCSLVPSHEESLFSVQTLEGSLVTREEPDRVGNQSDDSDVGLELTLGLTHAYGGEGGSTDNGSVGDKCNTELEF